MFFELLFNAHEVSKRPRMKKIISRLILILPSSWTSSLWHPEMAFIVRRWRNKVKKERKGSKLLRLTDDHTDRKGLLFGNINNIFLPYLSTYVYMLKLKKTCFGSVFVKWTIELNVSDSWKWGPNRRNSTFGSHHIFCSLELDGKSCYWYVFPLFSLSFC